MCVTAGSKTHNQANLLGILASPPRGNTPLATPMNRTVFSCRAHRRRVNMCRYIEFNLHQTSAGPVQHQAYHHRCDWQAGVTQPQHHLCYQWTEHCPTESQSLMMMMMMMMLAAAAALCSLASVPPLSSPTLPTHTRPVWCHNSPRQSISWKSTHFCWEKTSHN